MPPLTPPRTPCDDQLARLPKRSAPAVAPALSQQLLPLVNKDSTEYGTDVQQLSARQRRTDLLIAFGLFFAYGSLGLAWSVHKKLSWCEYIYFLVVTLTTVGYGDVHFSTTNWEALFGVVFIFLGITFVGTAISLVIGAVSGELEEKMAGRWGALKGAFKGRGSGNIARPRTRVDHMAMLASKNKERIRELYRGLFKHLLVFALLLAVGTVVMMLLEKWTWIQSLYFSVVTATTVGYGDLNPTTNAAKMFTAAFIILEFYYGANAIGYMSSLPEEKRKQAHAYHVLTQFGEDLQETELMGMLTSKTLRSIKEGSAIRLRSQDVNRSEFALYLLLKQGKLDPDDMKDALLAFDMLDSDDNGNLDEMDLAHHSTRMDALRARQRNAMTKVLAARRLSGGLTVGPAPEK